MAIETCTSPELPGDRWQLLLNISDDEYTALSVFIHNLSFDHMKEIVGTDDAELFDNLATVALVVEDAIERAAPLESYMVSKLTSAPHAQNQAG